MSCESRVTKKWCSSFSATSGAGVSPFVAIALVLSGSKESKAGDGIECGRVISGQGLGCGVKGEVFDHVQSAKAEHYLERKTQMLRSEDLGSAGAFIDTTGAKRKKKQEYYVRTDITTEEEEQLEALVFGRQPFKPRDAGRRLSETDSEEEEEQEEVSRWINYGELANLCRVYGTNL